MKNIHVLPTDKSSRLVKGETTGRLLLHNTYGTSTDRNKTQNIYITNYEEIKDKDYVLSDASIGALYLDGVMNTDSMLAEGQWKKIILTTDVDLIKDGVQEIDDTFLEWFVKNPSCEEIEVIPYLKDIINPLTNEKYPAVQHRHFDETKMIFRYQYKLIIYKRNNHAGYSIK